MTKSEIIPTIILAAFFLWLFVSLVEININTGVHEWNAIQVFLEMGAKIRK